MASRGLGSLTLDLIAKIGGFTGPLSKAERELQGSTRRMNKMANDFGRSIGSSLKAAAGSFLAFAGVTVSIGAAANAIKGAIDRADQLRDASIRLGVGVEVLSAYGYAAQQTGTDIEELNKGLLRLSRNATTALDPKSRQSSLFAALGISKDALTDLEKLVPQVANAFAQMEDGATKAALAQELFGRSGANLIEFLNQGESGLKTMTDRARELGVVIDDETAAAADDFNDKLADLKAAGTGLATQVASELLPQLTNLVDWATEFVSDGDNARAIADDVTDAMHGLAEAIRTVVGLGTGLSTIREQLAGAENAWRGFIGNFGFNGMFSKALKEGMPWAYKELGGGSSQAAPTPAVTRLPTVTVTGTRQQSDLEKRLAGFFATGGRTGGGGAKKTGKSDAEREAEQLKAAYDRLNASLAEQVALFGETSEAAKLRYELENGELSKLTQGQKDGLIVQAETLDLMREEADFMEERAKIDADAAKADRQRLESAQDMLKDMEFELSLLGMTNKERERAIALKYSDVDATSELGMAIGDMSDALYEANEAAAFVDDIKASLSDAFVDFVSGAKSAKEAFGDFADTIYRKALQLLADKAVEALFKSFSGASSGGYGESAGGWADFFGSANSGFGFASGGFTGYGGKYQPAGIVHKGEYVMPMDAVSRIGVSSLDRIARGGGVGGSVSQNFYTMGVETRRTQERKAQLAGREARRAMARTGR